MADALLSIVLSATDHAHKIELILEQKAAAVETAVANEAKALANAVTPELKAAIEALTARLKSTRELHEASETAIAAAVAAPATSDAVPTAPVL